MEEVANHLREVIAMASVALESRDAHWAQTPIAVGKWSPKEILGHLIDSASNNHQKIVRLAIETHVDLVGYKQDLWVEKQQYQDRSWADLLAFWKTYNLHLAHVIANLGGETLDHEIRIDGVGPFTLAFVSSDYVEHLKHHLLQIDAGLDLTSAFTNVYGDPSKADE